MAKNKVKDPNKLGFGHLLLWKSSDISATWVQVIMLNFLSIYASDTLGIDIGMVGALLLASKIVDGITDIFAGWLVDNTHTKLGKGRPYELGIIGMTVCSILLFSVRPEWSDGVKYAWIFYMYTFTFSVFATMRQAALTPYTIRHFSNNKVLVTKAASYGGMVTMAGSMIVNIIFPVLQARIATTASGWTAAVALVMIPATAFGILRFIFCKEDPEVDATSKQEPIKLNEIFMMFRRNRYVWFYAIVMLCYNIITNLAVGTYYFKYIVGSTAMLGILSAGGMLLVPVMLAFPALMKKIGSMGKMITYLCGISIVGFLVAFFSNGNLVGTLVGYIVGQIGTLPIAYYGALFVMNICTYNEMKGMPRMDGSSAILANFASKAGGALGGWITAMLLMLAGYVPAEGFVLLKNENSALPLKNRRIALFGMGARKTVKGGLGSGSVEERYSVSIEEGLKNAGYEITTQAWLNDYDAEYDETYRQYHDMVEEKVSGLTNPMEIILLAHSFVYRFPSGRLITEQDIRESATDTAVYVLMRQAGEGNDQHLEEGDYLITATERENLERVAAAYGHVILVINVGGQIELSFLDDIPGIDAVVLFVQGGEEGGNALADVLSGRQNFSGKLADTVPARYDDIPFGNEFSHLNGDLQNEYYREGIYAGYRYFDSFGKAVRYPFGFGLSYTDFSVLTESVTLDGTEVKAAVRVKNTGSVSGKEVVQLYVSAPGPDKEYQRLLAFAKTDELAAGAKQALTLSFRMEDAASYDEALSAWMLDAGQYLVRIGTSSRDTHTAAAVVLDRPVVTCRCRTCCASSDAPVKFEPGADAAENTETVACVLHADVDVFRTQQVDYTEPQQAERGEETALLDSLTTQEQAELLLGGELQRVPAGAHEFHGAAGKTATSLLEKGIHNVCFSDGPAGLNIVNRVYGLEDGGFAPADIPERYNWGMLGKMMKAKLSALRGTQVYRYATAWPVEMLLAQTWNAPLLREIGDAVGREMEEFGVTVWLAPGMNIHRNPLGGRTFEYYSEDPVLTGTLAAALTQGVQSHPGKSVCIKHFCCNNSEDNRNGVSCNLSERALREIYLKGFEIAVKRAQPKAVMSSYNLVNHVYTANRKDLLTDILRCEWGFDGLVMTDWNSTGETAAVPELCAPSGNDLIMPGGQFERERVRGAVENGTLSAGDVRRSAARVLRLILEGVAAQ